MGEIGDLFLHVLIGGGILGTEDAFFIAVGVQKSLSLLPGSSALSTQFIDLTHVSIPPIKFKV